MAGTMPVSDECTFLVAGPRRRLVRSRARPFAGRIDVIDCLSGITCPASRSIYS
jgi:hypothetical protein